MNIIFNRYGSPHKGSQVPVTADANRGTTAGLLLQGSIYRSRRSPRLLRLEGTPAFYPLGWTWWSSDPRDYSVLPTRLFHIWTRSQDTPRHQDAQIPMTSQAPYLSDRWGANEHVQRSGSKARHLCN